MVAGMSLKSPQGHSSISQLSGGTFLHRNNNIKALCKSKH